MLLLLLTRGEWVAMLCAITATLYASPLLLSPSTDWQFLFHCD
ncbi:Peptidase m24, partial [Globisporangium polare]